MDLHVCTTQTIRCGHGPELLSRFTPFGRKPKRGLHDVHASRFTRHLHLYYESKSGIPGCIQSQSRSDLSTDLHGWREVLRGV